MASAATFTILPVSMRQDRHNAQVDGAEQRDLIEHLLDEVGGGLTGTEAGDKAAVLLQVVGDLNGVELNGRIEVAEADDQQEIDDHVQHALAVHCIHQGVGESALLRCGQERRHRAG